jgi:hypothetical protein
VTLTAQFGIQFYSRRVRVNERETEPTTTIPNYEATTPRTRVAVVTKYIIPQLKA